jgi:hypothetical protein
MPDEPDDHAELRERIRATQRAAERLAGEFPRDGFATEREHRDHTAEVQALAALLQTLRDLVPAELQEQLREVTRQVLMLLRALVDWWIERLEADSPSPVTAGGGEPDVEDIPID